MNRAIVLVVGLPLIGLALFLVDGRGPDQSAAPPAAPPPVADTPVPTALTPVPPAPASPPGAAEPGEEPVEELGDHERDDPAPDSTELLERMHPDHDHRGAAADRKAWEPVLVRFAKAYPRAGDATVDTWADRLAADATKAAAERLRAADAEQPPRGRYRSHEVVEYGAEQVAAVADYADGQTVMLQLIFDGQSWRVFQVGQWTE